MQNVNKTLQKLMADGLFWVFAISTSLMGFIKLFEKISVDKATQLF